MLILRELIESDEAAFLKGIEEWRGEELSWHTFIWKPGMSFLEMLDRLHQDRLGIDLPPGRVPHTMLYAFVNGEIVGRVSIKHQLNEQLAYRGGHLGYAVAPRFRKRGYANQMVPQALNYFRKLELPKIMITCSDSNEASWRVIEKFGGKLAETVFDLEKNENFRRYWLSL